MDDWELLYIAAQGLKAAIAKSGRSNHNPAADIGPPEPDPFDISRRIIKVRTFEMPSLEDDARESPRVYVSR